MNVVSSPWRFPALGLVALLSLASRAADYQPAYLDPDDPGVIEHYCGDAPCSADNAGP